MARSRKQAAAEPRRLILDSGAVIALARGEQRARAFVASHGRTPRSACGRSERASCLVRRVEAWLS